MIAIERKTPMTRQVTVHSSASCKLTPKAHDLIQQLNNVMRLYPDTKIYKLAYYFGLSYTNARRYYYGMHQRNASAGCDYAANNYNQVRLGACCDLPIR